MSSFFILSTIFAAFCVLGVLAVGLVSMMRGGEFNKKYGNRLMQARVILQGLALLCFALAFMTAR